MRGLDKIWGIGKVRDRISEGKTWWKLEKWGLIKVKSKRSTRRESLTKQGIWQRIDDVDDGL